MTRSPPMVLLLLFLGVFSVLTSWIGYSQVVSPVAKDALAVLPASSTEGQGCLSIYPPLLLKNHTRFCGPRIYPRDLAPPDYNWNATGYNYYAAAIGIHLVTMDYTIHSKTHRHNLLYNSMMKCGSTSINRALKGLKASAEGLPIDSVVYRGRQNNLLVKPAMRIMSQLQDYQLQREPTNYTMEYFTTVRDPISRFVSAIGQEMLVRRPSDVKAQEFRDKCLQNTAHDTLECAIAHVQDFFDSKTLWNQPHFIPMTTILHRRTYGYNVSVILLTMDQVPEVVQEMTASKGKVHRNPKQSQGSDILQHLSVRDLTEGQLRHLCRIYHLDVQMMQRVGMKTLCDDAAAGAK